MPYKNKSVSPVLNISAPRRRGAVVVEFAVILPVLLLVFLSFLEVSRVLLLQHSIDTAAYEGARNAMVPGASADEAIIAAEKLCEIARLRGYHVEVQPPVLDESTSFITVKVTLPVNQNITAGSLYFKAKQLESSVTLMCERPPMVQLTGLPVLAEIVESYLPPPPPSPDPEPNPEPEPIPEPEPEPDPEPEDPSVGDPEPVDPYPPEDPDPYEPEPEDPSEPPHPSEPGLPVYRY